MGVRKSRFRARSGSCGSPRGAAQIPRRPVLGQHPLEALLSVRRVDLCARGRREQPLLDAEGDHLGMQADVRFAWIGALRSTMLLTNAIISIR
jgi:hypothetical protein